MPVDHLARYLEKRTRRRFAAVVRAHRDDVLNAAYRVLGDRGLAEDVTQEVFLKLLSTRWTAGEVRCGRALLVSQAFRSALALRRSEARRTERERRFAERKSSEAHDPQALIEVRDAVLGLPEDLRACPAAAPVGLYLHEDIKVGVATCEKAGALFMNLPVGNYEVKATKDGFSGARELVQVEAGKLARVALTLSR